MLTLSELIKALAEDGGFTATRVTDDSFQPITDGIAVADPKLSVCYAEIDRINLHDAVSRYVQGLRHLPSPVVGGWVDGSNGDLWLDVVTVYPVTEIDRAIQHGRDANQIAIFNLTTCEEIPTGGNGNA